MEIRQIYDPFDGLPVTITIFDDGSFSYTNRVTHKVQHGTILDDCLCLCLPLESTRSKSITASEAAKILNVSRMRITQLCDAGTLNSDIIGSSLFVSYDDVKRYAKNNRKPGRKGHK